VSLPPIRQDTVQEDPPSEKKVYVKTIINRFRVVGCFDSGSDLSIMHASLFRNIFGTIKNLDPSPVQDLRSFSNDSIRILGTKSVFMKFQPNHKGISATIYIIDDVPNQTPWLVGADILEKGLGQLSFVDLGRGSVPRLSFSRPEYVKFTT